MNAALSRLASACLMAIIVLDGRPGGVEASPAPPAAGTPWSDQADRAQAALNQSFWSSTRDYYVQNDTGGQGFNYWWQAHALQLLLDGYERTGNPEYLSRIAHLQRSVKANNGGTYMGSYYDDMGWEALANVRAYAVTGQAPFKATARALWTSIKSGWSTVEGGGIAWQKAKPAFKNTPANAPAAILGAQLYLLDGDPDDLAWAQKIYEWEKSTLVDPTSGLVYDGIGANSDSPINKNAIYSYNQGTFIGAPVALYHATRDTAYLNDAVRTADNLLVDPKFSNGTVLNGHGQGDGGLFKGITVRHLYLLAVEPRLSVSARSRYVAFLKSHGRSLSQAATLRPPYLFGASWTSPPTGSVDSSTEMSGVMMFEMMARLQAKNLL